MMPRMPHHCATPIDDLLAPPRRHWLRHAALLTGLTLAGPRVWALDMADLARLSNADASAGVKAALTQGVNVAVRTLGQVNGFGGNPQVRIPLPGQMAQVAGLLRQWGQGHLVDEVEATINRAAEQAVPAGQAVLVQAVQGMTVRDAKTILTGGDTSVTQFFEGRTRGDLASRFLPIVNDAIARSGLTQQYQALASRAARFGLLRPQEADLGQYVTQKTLDGLFWRVAEEERQLRADPMAAGSALLRRVFGAAR